MFWLTEMLKCILEFELRFVNLCSMLVHDNYINRNELNCNVQLYVVRELLEERKNFNAKTMFINF